MIATLTLWTALVISETPASPPEALHQVGLHGAVLGVVTRDPVSSNKTKVQLVSIEKSVVERTNAERARYGLPPLQVDEDLMKSARDHAQWMGRNRAFQHTRAAVAENIAMGQRDSSEALSSWMNSSGHRANILNPGHRRIGVAAFQTVEGLIYWCQQFRP
jgi:uncharacterized protein YkwD